MKKLLESVLSLLSEREWEWDPHMEETFCRSCSGTAIHGHEATCELVDNIARLKTAIAALSPDASHAEAILAHADGLEDEGDWRAATTRLLFSDPLDVAAVLTSIKVEAGEGYCSITQTTPGNYVISGIPCETPGNMCVAWTLPQAEVVMAEPAQDNGDAP